MRMKTIFAALMLTLLPQMLLAQWRVGLKVESLF